MRVKHLFASLLSILVIATSPARAQEKLRVITSFSILGDITAKIGGDGIDLATLVGADGDMHGFEPGAAAQRQLAAADLLIVNGLGFEPWRERTIESAGFKGRIVTASARVTPLATATGDVDPHAFQDPANILLYIDEIAAALMRNDPKREAYFAQRGAALKAEVEAADRALRERFAALPAEKRRILTSHDAFRYFGRAYGIDFIGIQGLDGEAEPSATDLTELVRQARAGKVAAIFLENMSNPAFAKLLAEEAALPVGGILYADSLSGPHGPAPDYLSLLRYNAEQVLNALQ